MSSLMISQLQNNIIYSSLLFCDIPVMTLNSEAMLP